MIVTGDEAPWRGAESPTFGHALSGKRAKCSDERQCKTLPNSPQTMLWLRKLSEDGFRASAASGRLRTLSTVALQQQKSADHFMNVVSQRCVPVFDILGDLSEGLRDECKFMFPVLGKALDELTKSAMDVSQMHEALTATKESRVAENAKLLHQATELRDLLAGSKLGITQLEETISGLKSSIKEKQSGRMYVDSTSRPIEELAAQRRELYAELQKECSAREASNKELSTNLKQLRNTHESWKSEQSGVVEQLQREHAETLGKNEKLQQEQVDLVAAISGLMEQTQKDKAALCLLLAQADSQGFCLDLLLSRICATEAETEEIKERLASATKEKNSLAEDIRASKCLMPDILVLIDTTQAGLQEQARKLEAAEKTQAASLNQAKAFKEKVLAAREASEAAKKRLTLVRAKLCRIREAEQEKGNQILMFAEEMQLSYQSDLPANAVATTATEEAIGRLNSLQMALSSTQHIAEETRSKCSYLQTECAAVQRDIEDAKRSLETTEDTQARALSIIKLEALKDQIAEELEAARGEVAVLAANLAESEALKQKDNQADGCDALCLAQEQNKWDEKLAELRLPNSAMRKAIAEEELAICDKNFRQQIRLMREKHEKEMGALETHIVVLQQEKAQQDKHIEELIKATWNEEENHEINHLSATRRTSLSARKKIHSRRLLGSSDASGTSLSTPHLHALREKLTMSSQTSSKIRYDSNEAKKRSGTFPVPECTRRVESQVRATKAQKTGRRSGGDSCFDIFAQ